jgi:hypothetical protein
MVALAFDPWSHADELQVPVSGPFLSPSTQILPSVPLPWQNPQNGSMVHVWQFE